MTQSSLNGGRWLTADAIDQLTVVPDTARPAEPSEFRLPPGPAHDPITLHVSHDLHESIDTNPRHRSVTLQ